MFFFFWNLGKKAFFFFFFTFEFFSFIVENNESDAPFDRWIRSSERECHVFASRGLGLLTRARVGKRRVSRRISFAAPSTPPSPSSRICFEATKVEAATIICTFEFELMICYNYTDLLTVVPYSRKRIYNLTMLLQVY